MSAGRMFGTATFQLLVESKDPYVRPRSFDLTMEFDNGVVHPVIITLLF